ncbi:nicotinamide-nucleotide amidohydrolase family protein, partial [Pseudomonas aeruginosa]
LPGPESELSTVGPGGWVAKVITEIAGSSAWFERGFVTYSNEAKAQMIGVREETLAQHGAVSEPVVVEMAIGALKAARADYGPRRRSGRQGGR